jgi:hypothetical protein
MWRWVLTSVVVLSVGCGVERDEKLALFASNYTLRANGDARPIDLSAVQFVGHCPENEKRAIARTLGRIPISNFRVRRISVVWPGEPLSAEVLVVNESNVMNLIFLSKEKGGVWDFRASVGLVR